MSDIQPKTIITAEDITPEYLLTRPLSYSSLKAFRKSPRHYIMYLNGEFKPSPAMELGSMLDCKLLTPENFNKEYLVINRKIDKRTNAGKAEWEDLLKQASLNKQRIAFAEDIAIVDKAIKEIKAHERANELIEGITGVQQTLRWVDRETGLPLIGKIDFESRAWGMQSIVDLKSSEDADPDEFIRKAYNYDYHFQTGMYLEGFHKVKYQFPNFLFLVVELSDPFNVSVIFCDSKFTAAAKAEVRGTLKAFKYCMDNKMFNIGYDFRLFGTRPYFSMQLPGYAKPRYEGYEI